MTFVYFLERNMEKYIILYLKDKMSRQNNTQDFNKESNMFSDHPDWTVKHLQHHNTTLFQPYFKIN